MPVACPVHVACGGCPLIAEPRQRQHAAKLEALSRALARHALSFDVAELISEGSGFGYRNRIRLRFEAASGVHFFNPEKVETCAVLEPPLQAELARLIALSRNHPGLLAGVSHLELRSADLDGCFGLTLHAHARGLELSPLARELERGGTPWLIGESGDPNIACQRRSPDGVVLAQVPLDAFWQINSAVNRKLVEAVVAAALQDGAERVLELFAGAGNFSLPLAARGVSLLAVERHAAATSALARASRAQGLDVRVECSSAEQACERAVGDGLHFDAIIIDGPRAGARQVVDPVAALAPGIIVVCSCNPETLARDLVGLSANGYRLEQLMAFDMFPNTLHVEILAVLRRPAR